MIEILSPHVANLIAAGEVVERPASAVKELIENSFDAGASSVTAEIKRGGVSLIRVTDNGEGMDAEDAARAFMRHATSKLRNAEDLQRIATMGFRGEALAAIAAVSRVELLTRKRGNPMGFSLTLEAGKITAQGETGCPEGTTIVIRDLFFNTPARQKFLKKDNTEGAAVQEAVVRAALSRPDCSVRLIKDGSQTLHTPGDGSLKNCMYSVFGSDFTLSMLPVEQAATDGIRVDGFIGSPQLARSSRAMQHFFVGGISGESACGSFRPVRSRIVSAALEEAFDTFLMSGRYPVCALRITMPPDAYDINVHPAKIEVKFQNDRAVFDAVYHTCREELRSSDSAPSVKISLHNTNGSPMRVISPESPTVYRMADSAPPVTPPAPSATSARPAAPGVTYPEEPRHDPSVHTGHAYPLPAVPAAENTVVTTENAPVSPAIPEWRLVGEVLSGYLLVESSEALWIIDKHAAHERLLFNRLKSGDRPFLSQQLITPCTVVLSEPERDTLLTERDFMEAVGFSIDEFGPGALIVRAAPGDIDQSGIPALLSELASLLRDKRRPDLRDEALRSIACKAAVKLGKSSGHADMEHLAGLVMDTPDLRHCPHGRPVAVRLTRSELGKQFGRL